jgi:dipeptidase
MFRHVATSSLLLLLGGRASACTIVACDGAASVNGAAYVTENTDNDDNDFRLAYVPARDHAAGALRPVYHIEDAYPRWVGYGRGDVYHPSEGQVPSKPFAQIPEVPHTYGYYESKNALMNEKGLAISESSCAAHLINKPPDNPSMRPVPVAILDVMTLMQLALERCATARCAVDTMGSLADEYGYLPDGAEGLIGMALKGMPPTGLADGRVTYDDVGEAYAIADASGEAWITHFSGGVKGVVKSAWAAQRVPKGHAAVVANSFTIGELPLEPNDDFAFPKNIRHAAVTAGLWDGNGPFHFSKIFAPNPYKLSISGNAPIPSYASLRQWRVLSLAAPSLGLTYKLNNRDLPFSVKVEKPLSHRDWMEFMSDHYAGTEFDLSQGVLAGPFNSPFRIEGGPNTGQAPRGIAILRTSYGLVAETGPKGSVAWYAMDTPPTSVFVPLDARVSALDPAFTRGHNQKYEKSSAWWAFNFVNNWMQLNYKGMSEDDVLPRRKAWQDRMDSERLEEVSSADGKVDVEKLARKQTSLMQELVADWWSLADMLIAKWNDARRQNGKSVVAAAGGTAIGYPQWWTNMIGFNDDIHPIWVQRAAAAPVGTPGAVAATVNLPDKWDRAKRRWVYGEEQGETALSATGVATKGGLPFAIVGSPLLTLLVGVVLGSAVTASFSGTSRRSLAEPLLAETSA